MVRPAAVVTLRRADYFGCVFVADPLSDAICPNTGYAESRAISAVNWERRATICGKLAMYGTSSSERLSSAMRAAFTSAGIAR